mmetsp:Transcript_20713/g.37397  ORF Transcript_20713/g.37397 Transcript_20713/m.37397 type:complete len:259 (+) Transcript_20713:137-913(+)|eukprot:CAMPEP_0201871514 /NCGR_PEP_ID=MMETSP0902-20130614/4418_1 /ASSEMBLY_ACC=CAM_ASM_000551 /TAXON_ID=420261 /ORGANISM="Thalassiosira antarctica, Strain CCMP982" /LENGTH=258 /DNA_ID=CAMNT_0048397521 /DNA_START=57 /DNA_END=833 /DNA_ORIENTATION=+
MLSKNNFLCIVTFAAGIIGASSFSPIHPALKRAESAFHTSTLSGECSQSSYQCRGQTNLFAESDEDENEGSDSALKVSALPPAAISSLPPAKDDDDNDATDTEPTIAPSATAAGTAVLFIDQKSKRILIEELGYKRSEVERLRPELAQPILTQRMYRPKSKELPEEWLLSEEETSSAMLQRLENESKYPLKFPLLAISLVLFGKGLSDALITIIKVNIDFPGVSLTEQFMGVPVLAIDAVCVVLGAALGLWTWKTMKD